jgi:hypothetical protein
MNVKLVAVVVAAGLVLGAGSVSAQTWTFNWSGMEVQGEDPFGGAAGSAVFNLTASQLTLTLTSTSSGEQALGHLLSGFVWDQSGFMITSGHDGVGTSALINGGSLLVGKDATGDTDLSGEWAWGDMVATNWGSMWLPASGSVGAYGVGAVGADGGFGSGDLFDTGAPNLFDNQPPDGIAGSIVGPGNPLNTDGFPNNGPFVENSMVFTWTVSGVDGGETITNANPFFGTDGAFAVPEPSAVILLGAGLAGFGLFSLRRKKTS